MVELLQNQRITKWDLVHFFLGSHRRTISCTLSTRSNPLSPYIYTSMSQSTSKHLSSSPGALLTWKFSILQKRNIDCIVEGWNCRFTLARKDKKDKKLTPIRLSQTDSSVFLWGLAHHGGNVGCKESWLLLAGARLPDGQEFRSDPRAFA